MYACVHMYVVHGVMKRIPMQIKIDTRKTLGICTYYIQWDLSIKDTLGPANLSTVERLSTLQR